MSNRADSSSTEGVKVGGNQVDNPSDDLPTDYWAIVSEIDATIFCIEQLAKQKVMRKPIEQMVDKATGYDKETESTLEYWSKRLKLLMNLLPSHDWHFKQADTRVTDLQPSDPEAKSRPSKAQKGEIT